MRTTLAAILGASVVLITSLAQGRPSSTETKWFDLEVSLDSAPAEFTMLVTVRPEHSFRLNTTDEGMERGMSGMLHYQHGRFTVDLAVREPGMSDNVTGLELQLGKPIAEGGYSSVTYLRVIKLVRHESRLLSIPPPSLPNKLTQPIKR